MPCWSRTAARHMMDRNGIHLSVRSASDPGVRLGRDALARCIVRNLNEYVASIVDERLDRFGFFVTLTLLDVESVFEEIQCACDQLHADGVVLLANAAGKCLGDLLSCIVAHRTRPPCHHGVRPSGNTFPRTGATRADVLAGLSAGDVQDGGGPDSLRCVGALPEDQIYPCPWRGIRALSVYRALLAMIAWEPAQRKLLTALCQGYGTQKNLEAFRRFYGGHGPHCLPGGSAQPVRRGRSGEHHVRDRLAVHSPSRGEIHHPRTGPLSDARMAAGSNKPRERPAAVSRIRALADQQGWYEKKPRRRTCRNR